MNETEKIRFNSDTRRVFDAILDYHLEHGTVYFRDGDPEERAKMIAAREILDKVARRMGKEDGQAAASDLNKRLEAFTRGMFFYKE